MFGQDLLVRAQLDELDRTAAAMGQSADARRAVAATAPSAASLKGGAGAGHAPGVWCWLLDLVPARARRHAAA